MTSKDEGKGFMSDYLISNKSDAFQGFRVTYAILQKKMTGERRSLHSTHMELFTEFGVLGLIIIFLLFGYPLMLINRLVKRLTYSYDSLIFSSVIFAVFLLSLQIPLFAMSGGSGILLVTFLFYLYAYRFCYKQSKLDYA